MASAAHRPGCSEKLPTGRHHATILAMSSDRRLGVRVPVELELSAYIDERLHRGMAFNLSDSGMFFEQVALIGGRRADAFGLEFELPGTGETIWARGQITGERVGHTLLGRALRFTGMARAHARLVRDYCVHLHERHLGFLLERIRAVR
jgi:hypothetical protein